MKCQFCSKPATVHLTDIVNNHKKELHLCQACAEAQQLTIMPRSFEDMDENKDGVLTRAEYDGVFAR